MTLNKKIRITWIDIDKGILIIAIILGHVLTDGRIRWWLYSFHVPSFFFISGYCYKRRESFGEYCKNKIRGIAIPYFVYSLISILIFYLGSIVYSPLTTMAECNPIKNIIVMLYGNSKPNEMRYNLPLWFLPCLFCVSMIAYGIDLIGEKRKKKHFVRLEGIILGIIVGMFFRNNESIALPWHMETASSMLVWFLCGIECHEYGIIDFYTNKIRNNNRIIAVLVSMGILVAGAWISFFNTRVVGVREEHYGVLGIYYLAAILGIVGCIGISVAISKCKLLEMLGRNTLGVLVIHKFPILFFQKFVPITSKYLAEPDTFGGVLCAVLVTAVVVICAFAGTYIIRAVVPWSLGIKDVQRKRYQNRCSVKDI